MIVAGISLAFCLGAVGYASAKPPSGAPVVEADSAPKSNKELFGGLADEAMIDEENRTDAPQSERTSRKEPLPKQLDGVGVQEKVGQTLPLDLPFTNSAGEHVTLRDALSGERPVLLTMNYSNCPMLCSIMLNGLVDGLEQMKWTIGDEFEVVTVSLDPTETAGRALSTKERYLNDYGRAPETATAGWTFLVGEEENVQALAEAVGFGYRYSETREEYLHAAAVMVLTPEAEVSRYLYGVTYSPGTIRLSLAEASDGKFASTIDQLLLFCFHYDEQEGRYAPVARNIMTLGGAVTVLLLGLFLGGFWLKEATAGRDRAV